MIQKKDLKFLLISSFLVFLTFVFFIGITFACDGDWDCDYDIYSSDTKIMELQYECIGGSCVSTGSRVVKDCSDLDGHFCSGDILYYGAYTAIWESEEGSVCCRFASGYPQLVEDCSLRAEDDLYCASDSEVRRYLWGCSDGSCSRTGSTEHVEYCSVGELCESGECVTQSLAAPSIYNTTPSPLQGGETGYTRFYYSPDDSRADGEVDSVGYTTEVRYLDEDSNALTGWVSTTSSFLTYATYYRVSFTISSNINYAQAQFRSKATHSAYNDSDWAYSGYYDINHIVTPSVTTLSATDISSSGGTLRGDLTDMGNDSSVNTYFQWGETTSLGNTTSTIIKSSTGNFSKALSGLDYNATYYYRAVATNDAGTSHGDILSFTTDTVLISPPDNYYNSSDLQGGETGYTRFYYSPDDSRAEGAETGVGYTTEARYYESGASSPGLVQGTSSFSVFDSYYRAAFSIPSDANYVEVEFRSKATHPDYYDSAWIYSAMEMIYHAPAQPGSFTSPTTTAEGGEINTVNWDSTAYWGNPPSTNKNYRLEVNYNGDAWEFLANTGTTSHYSHSIPADVSLETVRYRVRAESDGGESSYSYSSVFDIDHQTPEAVNLDWNEEDHDYSLFTGDCYGYCNSTAPATVYLTWDYYSEAGYAYDTADLQVSTAEGDFSSANLIVDVTDIGNIDTYALDVELDFSATYYWRVRVSSENGYLSDWAYSDFQTDKERAYLDFDWSPKEPYLEETVRFDNKTVPGDNSSINSWYWEFEGAEPASSTEFEPAVRFLEVYDSREIMLEATDEDSVVCSLTKTITPRPELPDWQEVDPFQ